MQPAMTFGLSIVLLPVYALSQDDEIPTRLSESTFDGLEMHSGSGM